jgi:hypothetical protein
MSARVIPMKEWIEGLEEAAQELLRTSLRFEGHSAKPAKAGGKTASPKKSAKESGKGSGKGAAKSDEAAPGLIPSDGPHCGTYIAVLGEANSMHLGIVTTPGGCEALARGLLGMRSSEELSEKDAVDGMSEVMNIVAGKVKSRLSDRDHGLRLGMPIFMKEPIESREGMEHVSADVHIGPVPCRLLVFRPKRAA